MALLPPHPKQWGEPQHSVKVIEKPVDPFNLLEPFFNNWTIGFTEPFELMRKLHAVKPSTQYPPYNIIETDQDKFEIQIAVAGLAKSEIGVIEEGDRLIVRGVSFSKEESEKVIHKGIASRDFTQTFILAPGIIVKEARMENGLLTIYLEREIPESLKPKAIKIK